MAHKNMYVYLYPHNFWGRIIYFLFQIATAMIGYTIHGNLFYSFVNLCFAPLAWLYWLITHNVNMTIIQQTFSFLFQ